MSKSYGGVGDVKFSKTVSSLNLEMSKPPIMNLTLAQIASFSQKAQECYAMGAYKEALSCCEKIYDADTYRTDNLLLLGATHFQLRNFSECIFYNQQCIRVDPSFAEAYGNLGNALKELGDVKGAVQFYMKAIKLKPRFSDAYNNLASAHLLLGEIAQAKETYTMALTLNPDLVDSHTNLGNLYKSSGDFENAKNCYLEAIRINKDFPIAWNNLAGLFKEEGQITTAIAYYKEAIRLCPEFADAHNNLGNVLKEDDNKIQDAIACYQTAIRLRPDFAIAHGNLGSCYYDLGDFPSAVKSFNYAIQLEPNFPDAFNNLGNALKEQGRIDEAISAYRSALHLKPDHPHAYNNLGNAMIEKGLFKEAIHCYVTAIRLLPRFSAANSNLGSVFKEQGKLEQAVAHYQEAIRIDPTFADAFSNLGNTLRECGSLDDALECYDRAIDLDRNYADAYVNKAALLKDCGKLLEAMGLYRTSLEIKPDNADAFANLIHTMVQICDWSSHDDNFQKLLFQLTTQLASQTTVPSIQPFHSLVYPLSLSELLHIARRYAKRAKMNVSLCESVFKFKSKSKNARLKVGYVSSDFGNHPVSHLMQSVFGLHSKNKFEVYCYSLSPSDRSEWRLKIESEVEHFSDLSQLHNKEAAEQIFADGIHILINLNGYTKGARNEIFALRPAPVQISMFGFCGSMGADYIDYIVSDRTVIPIELSGFYSEKQLNLPHCYLVSDHLQSSPTVNSSDAPSRSQYGISDDKFVFCNFNQLYKIDPKTFDVWMNLLKRVNNSVLWLLRFPPAGEMNILREARKRGVREEQIVFTDVASRDEHIRRGFLADLFLDTAVYNAHSTAFDILWSGTPLITLKGEKMASRVAASILSSVGLEKELVCSSLAEYEELAVNLAEDSEKLFSMRTHLENSRRSCAAFDTKRWVRNFELGLISVWKRQEQRLPPDHINVTDEEPVVIVADASIL